MNVLLFAVLPYVAVVLAVVGSILRYRSDAFSYSSQSSQFLENRALFWGSTAWHYGIVFVLLAHLIALVLWDPWAWFVTDPTRLKVLEVIGLALSLLAFVGLVVLLLRRLVVARVRAVTSPMDWVLGLLLLAQVGLGIWIALGYRWGSGWYVHTAVPWMHSLVTLDPKIEYMTPLPAVVRWHAVLGFVLIGIFPFTRLVHVITVPVTYLWRSYQLVIWNRRTTGSSRT